MTSSYLENMKIPNGLYCLKYHKLYKKNKIQLPKWSLNIIDEKKLPIYYLNNSHFKKGTYRIKKPGKYVLSEPIIFNPNPENNFQPYSYQNKYYNKFTYSLGFFAAITIESDNVVIDLNNYTLKQSQKHYLVQRFYANIELGNSPFTPNNGPANFGNIFSNCNNIIIKNGTLGLSSHHGIHGNNSTNLIFENLKIIDYEVGGISLNGCSNIVSEHIELKTIDKAEFNNKFVHLIICRPILKKLLDKNRDATINDRTIQELMCELDDTIKKIAGIAKNNLKFVDGNAYGLSFNGEGPIIGKFKDKPRVFTAYNIFVNDITIHSIKTAVAETPGYKKIVGDVFSNKEVYNKNIQKGPIGQVLDLKQVIRNKKYVGNILTDIHFILAKYSVISSIDNYLIEWADNLKKELSLNENLFVYKIDNMNHVMKGNIGIFFSNVLNSSIHNINVVEMINDSPLLYTTHNGQNNNAIAVVGSKDIELSNIFVSSMKSKHGKNEVLLVKN